MATTANDSGLDLDLVLDLKPKQKYGGALIHCQRDEFGLIEVVDTPQMRSLFFDSPVEQSRLYFHAPMTLSFEYQQVIEDKILAFQTQYPIKRLLMLGMGGGSIASHLNALQPNMQIHIVELRQAVIDIAYQYFHLPETPEIEAIQEDAWDFIAEGLSRYDVIIVDVFDEEGLPNDFTEVAFQENLLKNLKSPGLVLFNLWNHKDKHIKQQTDLIVKYWQQQAVTGKQPNEIQVDSYPIRSSENIILSIQV
jgi:spermidine synthase